ncbi:MAG: hypothetical protein ABSA06_01745 [Geobacteraceae bacterium]|jgi:hypothetical protein
MKNVGYLVAATLISSILLLSSSLLHAATDGTYNLFQVQTGWDGTAADRLTSPTSDYDYSYGDEGSVTYSLPWPFTFYGLTYSQITADTNGNIWFSATGSAHSFNLANTGRGPVISAWNNDLSSYFHSGVFIQHKTGPERVVVEWRAETYTDEGSHLPNLFETVLYQNGSIRLDYGSFTATTLKDFGSGVSRGDGTAYISLTNAFGSPYSLSGRSYGVGLASSPPVAVDPVTPPSSPCTTLTGTMQVGSTISITTNTGATVGSITYPTPTTWTAGLCNLPQGDTVVTVTATSPTGQQTPTTVTINYVPGSGGAPVPAMSPAIILLAMVLLLFMSWRSGRRASC